MVFLNPLVLLGMAAAAIPLILHLLNLRKLRTIHFSTLTFLKELQQTRIRRLKLRQLLLLLIRTLLIVFLILAFARPALRGTMFGGFGSHANSTLVFILDDSFSMTASDEHGEFFKQAKDAAVRLAGLLKEGDEAFLIRLSDLPRASIDPATHDVAALKTLIQESQTSSVRRPMGEALRLASRLLQTSRNANKEVYIVSDMQRTLFQGSGHGAGPDSSFEGSAKIFVVEIGSRQVPNMGIDSLEVRTQIFEQNKPVTAYVSVRNFNNVAAHDIVTSLFLDGTRVAQGNLSAGPWESAGKEFSASPKHSGFAKGYAELESDALEPDNRRYFTLSVPSRIGVAMVSGAPENLRFVMLAAGASKTGEHERPLLDVSQASYQKFPSLSLNEADVLLLSNVRSFTSGDAERIASFVKRGGGLIIFPGGDIDRDNYNTTLFPRLNIPPIEGIAAADPQSALTFQSLDLDHPLFRTMFEPQEKKKNGAVESPRILTALRQHSGRQGRTLISLNDGGAFLSEYKSGEGRILLFAVASDLGWSDFPLKGLFAPLVYRSMIYLSSLGEAVPAFTAGEEPVVSVRRPPHQGGEKYSLISPDGSEELIQPDSRRTGLAESALPFRLRRLVLPGFYEIRSGSAPLTVFGVNIDPRESDTRRIAGNDLAAFWAAAGISPPAVRSITQTDQLVSTILQLRYGVELWKHCIALALLMALLEMAVARDSRSAALSPASGAA
ncbi:MAG TPA: BatA and WFA domain-containing protein [Bacteroidota bacterium]|jgi:hypothetical protein